MKNTKGKFTGTGGLELFYQTWLPEKKPQAIVVIVHGVLEHCGRYMNLVNRLYQKGLAFLVSICAGMGARRVSEGTSIIFPSTARIYAISWNWCIKNSPVCLFFSMGIAWEQ
jgi:alpha-beta hydrolase superfamily lysophospholipase